MARANHQWLIGREVELSVLGEALEQARIGGAALLIHGEAGIGKSALVRTLARQAAAAGFAIAACRPSESETSYAYAALGDLIAPLLEEFGAGLPLPQRTALEQALYRDGDLGALETVAPGAVATATANLLLAAAIRGPLCVMLDDVQWLDAPTAQALRFALRRLSAPGVVVVVARRGQAGDGEDPLRIRGAFSDGRLLELEPGGLTIGAAHALLHRDLGLSLSRSRLIELHRVTRGNPLFVLEIGRVLASRTAPVRADELLPVPHSLAQLLSARIASATSEAAKALQIVAAADRPTFATLLAVGGSESRAARFLSAAEAAGLVEVEGGRLRPAHPLLASLAQQLMTPAQRRQLHRRLAEAEIEPESRARHLALATLGENREVAAALELAAGTARSRGATDSAADLLSMAVDRTPRTDLADSRRRRLLLGEALLDAGDLTSARRLADELLADEPPGREPPGDADADFRGRIALLRATIAWYLEPSPAAVQYLTDALAAGVDDLGLRGRIHMHLAIFTDFDLELARHHAGEATRCLEQAVAHDPTLSASLATALCSLFWSEANLGLPPREDLIDRALAIELTGGRADRSTFPGMWWLAMDRFGDARQRFMEMLLVSRETGDRSGEPDLLTRLAEVAFWEGSWMEARRFAEEALAAAQQEGQQHPDPALRIRALIDVHVGELDDAERMAEEALARLEPAGDHILAAAWLVVAVLAAVSRGDAAHVDRLTARSRTHLEAIGIREPFRLDVSAERVAALCQLERLDEAEALLAELTARHERIPRPSLASAIARGRALLASRRKRLAEAIEWTDPAVESSGVAWSPFERARTLLVRGQVLRRARDRRRAGEALESARATFAALGAAAWIAQAEAELGRLGRHRPGSEDLTPAEREVATLAASGLSTKQVAARLFISPKTAEAHLSHVYGKLGISSRAQLGARMGAAASTPEE